MIYGINFKRPKKLKNRIPRSQKKGVRLVRKPIKIRKAKKVLKKNRRNSNKKDQIQDKLK